MRLSATPLQVQKIIFAFFLLLQVQAKVSAQNNTGIEFNGTNGHAVLGTVNPAGNFSTGLTIESWVKWNAFNPWSRIVDMGNGAGSNNLLFANETNSGRLRFEVYVGGTQQGLSTSYSLQTGRWYHVAVTQTSTGLTTLYVDGIVAATATIQRPLDVSRSQSFIGRSNWSMDGYLNGRLDEVRIWNKHRTAEEIRKYMLQTVPLNSEGLVAYYQFNEGSGSIANNSTSNNGAGNGTLSGGYTRFASPVQITANAVALDGVNDYANIGSPLTAESSYTKEAWVYVTKSLSVPQNIISSNRSPFWIADGKLRGGNNGPTAQIIDPETFPTSTWMHVAVSYDNTSKMMRLYRNGVQVNSATVNEAYQEQTNFVGAWFNGSGTESYLGGDVDEIRIWNSARTGTEISANMNRELNAANEPNLVAYYTFNQGVADGDNTGFVTVPNQKGATNATLVNLALSGTTSNYDQQNAGITALPVRFGQFIVQKQNKNVQLQWSTISEQNSLRFVAEHSTNGKDWKDVGARAAAGNSSTKKDYSVTHTTPAKGLNYYRVAQVDRDNKVDYSVVRTILIDDKGKTFTVLNSPVTNRSVQLQVNNNTTLSLYTQEGRLLWTREFVPGLQQFFIDGTAKGIYYLTGKGATERIIVQ